MLEIANTGRWISVISATTGERIEPGSPGVENVVITDGILGGLDSKISFGDSRVQISPSDVPASFESFSAVGASFPYTVEPGETFWLHSFNLNDQGSVNLGDFGGMVLEVTLEVDDGSASGSDPVQTITAEFAFEVDYVPEEGFGDGADASSSLRIDVDSFFTPSASDGPYQLLPVGLAQNAASGGNEPIFLTEFGLTGGIPTYDIYATLVAVAPENTAPVLAPFFVETTVGEEIAIPVLEPALDAEDDPLSIVEEATDGLLMPQNGRASVDGEFILYRPDPNFVGTDGFTYAVADDEGLSATETITVTVAFPTDGPDFIVTAPPFPIDNPLLGIEDTVWSLGNRILVTVDFVNIGGEYRNIGGEDGLPSFAPPDDTLLLARAPFDAKTERSLGLLETEGNIQTIKNGETGAFSGGFEIDEELLKAIGFGEYYIYVRGDFTDADVSNNAPESVGATRVTLSEAAPELLGEAVSAVFFGGLLDDLFISARPADNTVNGAAAETGLSSPVQPAGLGLTGLADGRDTIHYRLSRDAIEEKVVPDAAASLGGTIEVTDLSTGLTDRLISIERLSLTDGVYLYDLPGDDVPFTYRLYSAAFARTPDEPGLRFWNDQRNDGLGDRALANFFIEAPEFAEKFGADTTDAEFIDALYQNVLLREADQAGFDFWLPRLESPTFDRADMLLFFSNGPENIERNADNYDDGVWVV